jgi:hypothetical protein
LEIAVLLLLCAACATFIVVAVRRAGGVGTIEPWAKMFQGIITIVAIISAGYLYFVERRSKPHADVSQTAQAVSLGDDNVALEASVVVKNLGTQLLKINRIYSRVQPIDIRDLGVRDLAEQQGEGYWNAVGNVDGQPRPVFNGTELRWRQLKFHDRDIEHEIEPGESDLVTVSFVFPCPEARFVRVATDVTKPGGTIAGDGSEKGVELVWKTRTMVDLQPICAPERQPESTDQ